MSNKQRTVNFPVNLIIYRTNSIPILEMRRRTNDVNAIKEIIDAAILEKPIIVFPVFTNGKAHALGTLVEHKIIKFDPKENTYEYII